MRYSHSINSFELRIAKMFAGNSFQCHYTVNQSERKLYSDFLNNGYRRIET